MYTFSLFASSISVLSLHLSFYSFLYIYFPYISCSSFFFLFLRFPYSFPSLIFILPAPCISFLSLHSLCTSCVYIFRSFIHSVIFPSAFLLSILFLHVPSLFSSFVYTLYFLLFLLPTFISFLPSLSFLPSFLLTVSPSPSCTSVHGKLVRFQFPALHP